MSERCPLSNGNAPGFYYDEDIPEICRKTCAGLWDHSITEGHGDFEAYKLVDTSDDDEECWHPSTEYSHSSLQAAAVGSALRFYTIVDSCASCEAELTETSYEFRCPQP